MRRWLLNKDDAPVETDFPIFTDAQLQCTRSGQVLEDFKGKSVFHLNALRAQELAEKRAKNHERTKDENTKTMRQLFGSEARSDNVGSYFPTTTVLERKGYKIARHAYSFGSSTHKGVSVPVLEFIPDQEKKGHLLVYLHGRGMVIDSGPGGPIEKLVLKGQRVLALDLRGMGETAPGIPPKGKPNYFGVDSKEAFLGLHLSRPLLSQRVDDLQRILALFPRKNGIHLVGVEAGGPVALHAAALDSRIKRLTLERSLVSWSSVVENPISYNQLSNVIPGVLKHYDLPDLTAMLAPLPLSILEPVDGMQRPISQDQLQRAYASCRASYAKAKAESNLILKARR